MLETLHAWHLTHPLQALAIMAPFLAGAWFARRAAPAWAGAAAAIAWYHAREVRDTELHLKRALDADGLRTELAEAGSQWAAFLWAERGWDVTRWTLDSHLDFWPVVVVAFAAAGAVHLRLARRRRRRGDGRGSGPP